MMYALRRDQPAWLQLPLNSVCGTAILRSEDGHTVSVPLASLISSPMIRSIMSDLHPALMSPLILSCPVTADVLCVAGEVFNTGLARVDDDRMHHEVNELMIGMEVLATLRLFEFKQEPACHVDSSSKIDCEAIGDIEFKIELERIDSSEQGNLNESLDTVSQRETVKEDGIEIPKNIDKICEAESCEGQSRKVMSLNCDLVTDNLVDIKNHVRILEGGKTYRCPHCDYSTKKSGNIKKHIRKHTGDKPFKCPHCDYSSTQKSRITEHIRIHSAEKPFKCPYCDLSSAYSIAKHIRRHFKNHQK